jgi:hypothetical protein
MDERKDESKDDDSKDGSGSGVGGGAGSAAARRVTATKISENATVLRHDIISSPKKKKKKGKKSKDDDDEEVANNGTANSVVCLDWNVIYHITSYHPLVSYHELSHNGVV